MKLKTKFLRSDLVRGYRHCGQKYEPYDSVALNDTYKAMFRKFATLKKIVAIGFNTVNGCSTGGRFVIGTLARLDDYSDRVVVINRNGQSEEVRYNDIDRIYIDGIFTPEWRNYGKKEY